MTDRADSTETVDRLAAVRGAIADACVRAGRDPASVTLVGVSKTVPVERIEAAIAAGHRAFGENRVQEAKAKWPALRTRVADLELHLLGPLQSNKVRDAVALFDAIHSVDRTSLCAALARHCAERGSQPSLFVQVNTGAEPQKAGVMPDAADRFLAECAEVHGLEIVGLMCVPPVHESPAPHFSMLAGIAARNGLRCLSMGMSADFAVAIEHGATHVRVGSALFGSRPRPAVARAGA